MRTRALRRIILEMSSNEIKRRTGDRKALLSFWQEIRKSKTIPSEWIKNADELTEKEKQRFIIADNIPFGEWDVDTLANEWNTDDLENWGLELDWDDDDRLDNLEEGEELEFEQSVQMEPPKEYILIMAEPNSVEWEELKEMLKLKMVRRGGYKKGSAFDSVAIERVIWWDDFKKRLNVNSSTK